VDFRDLNKANPKDEFPLPNVDILVDVVLVMNASPLWMVTMVTTRSSWS